MACPHPKVGVSKNFDRCQAPRYGSKPARTHDRPNQSPPRAEFFALPIIALSPTRLHIQRLSMGQREINWIRGRDAG